MKWAVVKERIRAATQAISGRLVRMTRQDFTVRTPITSVTQSRITSALSTAANGNLRDLADIYDLMPASDTHLFGIRRQLIAGVISTPAEVVPANETPEATKAAAFISSLLDNPTASLRDALIGVVEGDLRGVELVEIIWNDELATPRTWVGFRLVPQQRIRYDANDGSVRVALDPSDPIGHPLSEFPGKFIVIVTNRDVPNFALRGSYRCILPEWHGRHLVSQWELQAIERHGMPIAVGKADTDADKAILNTAFGTYGSAGSLIVSKSSEVELKESAISASGALVHETYMEKSAQRITVALLGAQQSATVGTDQGSKASAGAHLEVRRDVLYSIWETASEVIARDLFAEAIRLNLGPQFVPFTPKYEPQFDEPTDMMTTAAALKVITEDLALDVGESFARELLSVPEPGADERRIGRTANLPPLAPVTPFPLAPVPDAAAPVATGGDVQTQALNGAQMAGLQSIVQAVADGLLPVASAITLVRIAIPTISEDLARQLVMPAAAFKTPTELAPAPAPAPLPAAAMSAARDEKAQEETVPKDAGAEITDPLAAMLDDLGSDDEPLHFNPKRLDAFAEADVPKLTDELAAALARALLIGREEVQREREEESA